MRQRKNADREMQPKTFPEPSIAELAEALGASMLEIVIGKTKFMLP